jgi:hypothetical protein
MNELFAQIKDDLTDRRLLPIVAVVCALLVAGLAYALLGGGGSSATSNLAPVPVVPSSKGIAVTGATQQKAVAETTDGFKDQAHGVARDPFAPLPGSGASEVSTAAAAPAPSAEASSSSSSSSASSSGSETPSGSGSEPSTASEPQKSKSKPKAKTAYDVAIKFGVLPPNTAPELAQLTEYKKLQLQTPLPSAKQPLLVFRGVTSKGRSATFTLVGEAILTGTGACLPSPQQCQAVDLKPGETEQLNYLQANGEQVVYELRVLSIEKRTASAARAKASVARRHAGSEEWGVSRVGQELLRKAGLVALPFLRYSSQPGVLVFASPKPHKAHAHGARG